MASWPLRSSTRNHSPTPRRRTVRTVFPIESQFLEKGILTPEEFELAGDELVSKYGTWTWETGDADYRRSFLREDKQFLMTRNVSSLRRPNFEDDSRVVAETENDDDGLILNSSRETKEITEVKADEPVEDRSLERDDKDEATLQVPPKAKASSRAGDGTGSGGRPVLDETEGTILKARTYDVSVTYDKYYQTPRVWLRGYDEDQQPLTPEQIMDDISPDHETTVETHHHMHGVVCVAVHPCRHAEDMKKFMEMSRLDAFTCEGDEKKRDSSSTKEAEDGSDEASKPKYGLQVSEALFLFLKFMNTVIPTIGYEYTPDT